MSEIGIQHASTAAETQTAARFLSSTYVLALVYKRCGSSVARADLSPLPEHLPDLETRPNPRTTQACKNLEFDTGRAPTWPRNCDSNHFSSTVRNVVDFWLPLIYFHLLPLSSPPFRRFACLCALVFCTFDRFMLPYCRHPRTKPFTTQTSSHNIRFTTMQVSSVPPTSGTRARPIVLQTTRPARPVRHRPWHTRYP
jgi:hypothetical protein